MCINRHRTVYRYNIEHTYLKKVKLTIAIIQLAINKLCSESDDKHAQYYIKRKAFVNT